MYSQILNCAASFPVPTFLYLVSDLNISMIGPPIFLQPNRWTDRGIIYVNRSQIHECRIWERDCTVPVNRKSVDTLPLTYAEPAHLAQVTP
jgi:hypothetical protein